MRFAYSYKTSDGVRHEASIEARSRDEVFSALRTRGIRPIKVSETEGLAKTVKRVFFVWMVPFTAFMAASMSIWIAFSLRGRPPAGEKAIGRRGNFTSAKAETAYTNLAAMASDMIKRHNERLGEIGVDLLANYALVENTADPAFFTSRIRKAYRAIDDSRHDVRTLFRTLYDIFPPECMYERTEAQNLYVETMDEIDKTEARLANDDKAFRMLDANRGKWHVVRGMVTWKDAKLAKEFEFLQRDTNPAEIRWRKDFGAIESNVVTNPAVK